MAAILYFSVRLIPRLPSTLKATASSRLAIEMYIGDNTSRSRDTLARTSQCDVTRTALFSPLLGVGLCHGLTYTVLRPSGCRNFCLAVFRVSNLFINTVYTVYV
jgi:hypothetical protein